MAKTITTRVQHKYDTIENWAEVENDFIPLAGEFVIYAPGTENGVEYGERLKIGDGVKTLAALDFVTSPTDAETPDVMPIAKGGTGATSAAQARTNLGVVPTTRTVNGKALSSNITLTAEDIGVEYSTTDLTAGTSELATGKLYFVYE